MLKIAQCLAFVTLVAAPVASDGLQPSPYEHDRPEIDAGKAPTIVPGVTPLKTQKYFLGERELLGYDPRFMPTGDVAFDLSNRPYIRAANPYPTTGDGSEDGYIQTLDAQGKWVVYSIPDEIRRVYPGWDGIYQTGVKANETRIVFDEDGDAYTRVFLPNSPRRVLILHLPNGAQRWGVYELSEPGGPSIERVGIHSPKGRPPLVLRQNEGRVSLYDLKKNPDGTLTFPKPVVVSPDKAFLAPNHSGASNSSARVGNKTYITYGRLEQMTDADGEIIPGTPQYVVTYDHDTGEVSAPVLLGFGRNCYVEEPDVHNGPAIVADSEGYLHAVLGAHQDQFWYVRSKTTAPVTAADWTEPEALGVKRWYDCGLTYVTMVIDRDDTLHVVGRNMSRGTDMEGNPIPTTEINHKLMTRTLDYLRARKQEDGTWKWEEMGPLYVPFHGAYSIFYQKLTIDRKDRLFLSYYYYADQLSDETKAAYRQKWPEEFEGEIPEGERFPVKPHDPVIMMSDDGGDTWRIALTADFVAGTIDE